MSLTCIYIKILGIRNLMSSLFYFFLNKVLFIDPYLFIEKKKKITINVNKILVFLCLKTKWLTYTHTNTINTKKTTNCDVASCYLLMINLV